MRCREVACKTRTPVVDRPEDEGGVVIEYGVLIATIVFLLAAAAGPLVTAVQTFFSRLPAGFPAP